MEAIIPEDSCTYCGHGQKEYFKFCSKCGKRNSTTIKSEEKSKREYLLNMRYLGAYVLISTLLLLTVALTNDTFETLVIWTACFAVIDLVFALLQPSVWNYLKIKAIKVAPVLSIIAICIATGIFVSWSIDHISLMLFEETEGYMPTFYHLENPLFYSILFTAVFPAVFEELAFRGFVFNNLKAIGGKHAAIWGSSFLFGLVHLSLLSIVWIIPFGLLLAFYRQRYSTLIYGMVGHFTHNTTVILIEHYGLF